MTDHLRPIEKRILAMRDEGLPDAEIGRRVAKSAERVDAIAGWARLPGRGEGDGRTDDSTLTPLQRRVVEMRCQGESYEQIGERFRRSPRFIRQVEGLARFRQFEELLG